MIQEKKVMDFYKYYHKHTTHPALARWDSKNPTFAKIFGDYIKFVVKKILDGYDVQLGHRFVLGTFGMRGKKIKPEFDENGRPINLAPDFKATLKLWKERPDLKEKKHLVYHLNEHSEGVRYGIKWSKKKSILPAGVISFYSLAICKPLKRQISEQVRSGKEYEVIND